MFPLVKPHRNLQKSWSRTLNCHCRGKRSRQNIHKVCAICEDGTDWCKLLLRESQDDQICSVIKVVHWQAHSLECHIIRSFWHVMIFLIIISLQILLMRSPQEHRKELQSLIAEGQLAARAPFQRAGEAAVTSLQSMEMSVVMTHSLLGSGALRSQGPCSHQRRILGTIWISSAWKGQCPSHFGGFLCWFPPTPPKCRWLQRKQRAFSDSCPIYRVGQQRKMFCLKRQKTLEPLQLTMKYSISYWFSQATVLTRLFCITILPCLWISVTFPCVVNYLCSLCSLLVLNCSTTWSAGSKDIVGCLLRVPSCFLFPSESTLARICFQRKYIFSLFCNRGWSSSWIRRKNFYSDYFMIFPH